MRLMVREAAVVYSSGYRCDVGAHVFPMEKFGLLDAGDVAGDAFLEPGPASREDLLRVHSAEYLDDLEQLRWTLRTMSAELPLTADIVRAYRLAAGGTTLAAREALTRGFGVNLGGGFHHAYPDHAEGFCYLNDIAIAIRTLQHEGRVRRAAGVDSSRSRSTSSETTPRRRIRGISTWGSRTGPATPSTWSGSGRRSNGSGSQRPRW